MKSILEILHLVKKTQLPGVTHADDHDAHVYWGHMHLALGHAAAAEAEFAVAYKLRPSEPIRLHLDAIRNGQLKQHPSVSAGAAPGRAA